ncbi:MAG: TIGR01212 family radical SAM protein [Lachnospiraceae bacterium]|nr:TIGR01212 family radical SAM protein [Lachnospiraceae bacterium]MDD5854070.1 TIGR01212 family radical SAM protein [Lachnospiraceae bacterium]
MITVNEYCKKQFGEKLYKISLDGGMSCPNRDGKLDTRGCIFCSAGGSGDFTPDRRIPLDEQIEDAKKRVSSKYKGTHYIAYFQAYTNTYAPVEKLRALFMPVIKREDIAVLSIATRPDCLSDEVLDLLRELNDIKPVWVELGLQTIHEKTVDYIRRGYPLPVYDKAIRDLDKIGIHTITHLILGLPGETKEDMLQSVRYVAACGSQGIKLQLLHVLKGTDLASDYEKGLFQTLSFDEYMDLLADCVRLLPKDMVVHRLTGDGPKNLLMAPMWSADKKRVMNTIHQRLKKDGLYCE